MHDLTGTEGEEGETPLVIVETVSAPTSQTTTPVTTQAGAGSGATTQAERQPMDIDGSPPLPSIATLLLASQHIEGTSPPIPPAQREAATGGTTEAAPETAGPALLEHDYARGEEEVHQESGSDDGEPQPTPETQPTTSAPAEDVAARERESSGEYVDAPTGSQPDSAARRRIVGTSAVRAPQANGPPSASTAQPRTPFNLILYPRIF